LFRTFSIKKQQGKAQLNFIDSEFQLFLNRYIKQRLPYALASLANKVNPFAGEESEMNLK
jgi:hypothetical protein